LQISQYKFLKNKDMKKLFSIFLLVSLVIVVSGQSTVARWENGKTPDNTGRVLDYKTIHSTKFASYDTLSLLPNNYATYVTFTDTIEDTIWVGATTTYAHFGDMLYLTCINSSGSNHKIYLLGTSLSGSGTSSFTLNSATRFNACWMFDGVKYILMSKSY
jgi:hypothetical protein